MKKTTLVAAAFGALSSVAFPSYGQDCRPRGPVLIGSGIYFDHIANGTPTGPQCWTSCYDMFRANASLCGFPQYPAPAFEFRYRGCLTQRIHIPADAVGRRFSLSYELDFQDPHSEPQWTNFKAEVRDNTTQRELAAKPHNGPDLSCARQDISFEGDLAGHELQVTFYGSGEAYPDSHVRVRNISLFQW